MQKMLFFIFTLVVVAVQAIDEAIRNGANDVIVVRRSDGSYASSKWEAQFGKLYSPFVSREGKEVHLFVNNVPARPRLEIHDRGNVLFKGSSENYMTSRDLQELNLNLGRNKGKYISRELGISITFSVYLYDEEDKFVLTDIDGTITESDIKGQVLPILGLTAEHERVVELMDKIDRQGYNIIYLSARSFSSDLETKDYLFDMLQNISGFSLPLGPVLLSPNSFISSLFSEVVTKNPDEEKTETILDIWRAFETSHKDSIMDTIVTAYGNKETDVKAYLNAGIVPDKIFIVNPDGKLVNIGSGWVGTYGHQTAQIHQLYPSLNNTS